MSAVPHRVVTTQPDLVRLLIERALGVEGEIAPCEQEGRWAVCFRAPANANLDFLRPYFLPPRTS